MSDFSEFYDDTQIPYASKEERAKLVATGEGFTITAVNERTGEYKGKRQEQWVVTIDSSLGERLITLTKSSNRDRHLEEIAQRVPVTGVALAKVGKNQDVWAFVPASKKSAPASNTRRPAKRR